ncbi:MAG: hypothetical protein HYR96_12620 [Deltaproteobacteria bacterium]|nr:hypothetical protein [Deltaproteobacteria bacterium]MBI3293380.1 hypothetical protein [Deltaproteobacteria bacterium]
MKHVLFVSVAGLFFSTTGHAKLSEYSHLKALQRVLASKALGKHLSPTGELSGLELLKASVDSEGEALLNKVFTLSLTFAHHPVGFRSCTVPVELKVVKDPKAPAGVTAAILGEPEIGRILCIE